MLSNTWGALSSFLNRITPSYFSGSKQTNYEDGNPATTNILKEEGTALDDLPSSRSLEPTPRIPELQDEDTIYKSAIFGTFTPRSTECDDKEADEPEIPHSSRSEFTKKLFDNFAPVLKRSCSAPSPCRKNSVSHLDQLSPVVAESIACDKSGLNKKKQKDWHNNNVLEGSIPIPKTNSPTFCHRFAINPLGIENDTVYKSRKNINNIALNMRNGFHRPYSYILNSFWHQNLLAQNQCAGSSVDGESPDYSKKKPGMNLYSNYNNRKSRNTMTSGHPNKNYRNSFSYGSSSVDSNVWQKYLDDKAPLSGDNFLNSCSSTDIDSVYNNKCKGKTPMPYNDPFINSNAIFCGKGDHVSKKFYGSSVDGDQCGNQSENISGMWKPLSRFSNKSYLNTAGKKGDNKQGHDLTEPNNFSNNNVNCKDKLKEGFILKKYDVTVTACPGKVEQPKPKGVLKKSKSNMDLLTLGSSVDGEPKPKSRFSGHSKSCTHVNFDSKKGKRVTFSESVRVITIERSYSSSDIGYVPSPRHTLKRRRCSVTESSSDNQQPGDGSDKKAMANSGQNGKSGLLSSSIFDNLGNSECSSKLDVFYDAKDTNQKRSDNASESSSKTISINCKDSTQTTDDITVKPDTKIEPSSPRESNNGGKLFKINSSGSSVDVIAADQSSAEKKEHILFERENKFKICQYTPDESKKPEHKKTSNGMFSKAKFGSNLTKVIQMKDAANHEEDTVIPSKKEMRCHIKEALPPIFDEKLASTEVDDNHMICSTFIIDRKALSHTQQCLMDCQLNIQKDLSHENIQKLYRFLTGQFTVAIFEHCGTTKLSDMLEIRSICSSQRSASYIKQIAAALHHCHSKGIMHRDVRAENVLIPTDGSTLKLTGFHAASYFLHRSKPQKFVVYEPLHHLPPELIHCGTHDEKVDSWSLGVLLYQLLTGRKPFVSQTAEGSDSDRQTSLDELLDMISSADFEMPDFLEEEAKSLIEQLIAIRPRNRLTMDKVLFHEFL